MSVLETIRLLSLGCPRILLAALVLFAASPAAAEMAAQRLSLARGTVEVGRGEPAAWQPAREGETLAAGDAVRTGHDGRAEIDLGGATARLYENSLLRIPAAGENATGVSLEEGSSLFDVLRRREGESPFEVRTQEVVVSVKGTRFGVSLVGELAAVSVYRGMVGVLAAGAAPDTEVLVRDGFAATGDANRGLELSVLPDFDAWQSWSSGAASPAPAASPGSASTELEAARAAARRDVESEVRSLAVDLDPAAREDRPDKLRPDAKTLPGPADPSRSHPKTIEFQPPAAPLDAGQITEPKDVKTPNDLEIDPVSAVQSQDKKEALDDEVSKALVENALTDPTSPSSSSNQGSLPFSIQWVTSGGPNHVVIQAPDSGVLANLTRDQIEDDILADGRVGLFGPQLLEMLDKLDVDPEDFAEKLLDLR